MTSHKADGLVYVRGADSAFAQELKKLVPIERIPRGEKMPLLGDRYLFCQGLIRQKRGEEQTDEEWIETMDVNFYSIIKECSHLIENNQFARICIIGSEAAFTGSYDGAYAHAKREIHDYVERKALKYPGQQLVCVAPTITLNTAMTNARNAVGKAAMEARRKQHPKARWLEPMEVAKMIHFLLYVDKGYTTNVVIRMNGGEHAR